MESSTTENELISILICSRGRRSELEHLVADLQDLTTSHPFEIVVVEETDSPRIIEGVVYLPHPIKNLGIPYARNLALKQAKGSIIVFIDDDCTPCNNWLDHLLEPFRDVNIVGVQGGVTVPEETNAIGWAETILGFPGGGIKRIVESEGINQDTKDISTLNCAYRKWVIDKIGGFDERLKLGDEDTILAIHACNYGLCVFVPNAFVKHLARENIFKIWSWFVRRGRAELNTLHIRGTEYFTFRRIIKSSIGIKLCLIIFMGIAFRINLLLLCIIALCFYCGFQYNRYFVVWGKSDSPIKRLFVIPIVKLVMDMAMDWGRIRGALFDKDNNSHL